MRAFLIAAILFAVPFFCTDKKANANGTLPQPLPARELDASVTGLSLAIMDRTEARSDRPDFSGVSGCRFESIAGIRTTAVDTGAGSLAQAGTSLAVRAAFANARHF